MVNHEGNQSVLMVVDVQVGVMRHTWDAPRIVQNIAKAVEKARQSHIPVIWVQHADDDLLYGSADWQIVPELSPMEDEVVIHKHFNSSFEQTILEEMLTKMGAAHVVLAGAATNWCIRATAYGALDRGYDLTLIKDAHTTESIEFQNGMVIEADKIIQELNVAMKWLNYPDRKNSAVAVDEIDFASLSRVH